jgi:hypothetical protein
LTTYATYKTGETSIRNNTDRKLVMGWLVVSDDRATETRYAVRVSGEILKSEPITVPNHDFNTRNRVWEKVDAVPDAAEWIGHYPDDLKVKVGTVDITPKWIAVLPVYIEAIQNGSPSARNAAVQELQRMATLADLYFDHVKGITEK